jgi:hypothetical protein
VEVLKMSASDGKQFTLPNDIGAGLIDLSTGKISACRDDDAQIPILGLDPPGRITSMPDDSVITRFASGHGWTSAYATTGTITLNDATNYCEGSQCATITTSGAGDNTGIKHWALTSMDFTAKMLKVKIKITNGAHLKADNTGLFVYLGSNSMSKYFLWTPWNTQTQPYIPDGVWTELTLPFYDNAALYSATTGGNTPDRGAVTDIAIKVIDDGTGVPVTVSVQKVSICSEPATAYPYGCLSFAFDDSYETTYTIAKPLMDAYGYHGTCYTLCNAIGQTGYLTTTEMDLMQDQGWDISYHAYNSTVHNVSGGFTGSGLPVIQKDFILGKAWLKSHGYHGHSHGAFPGGYFKGATGSDILTLAKKNFKAFRTISSATLESYPPAHPHRLRAYTVINTTALATLEAMIDDALAAKVWLIIVFHKLATTPSISTEFATADFTSLLAYNAGLTHPMTVKTVAEVLSI